MKIISIDPGYDRIGVAIIETINGKESLVFSACITTDKKLEFYSRMDFVQKKLNEIIVEHQPDHAVIEQLYFAKNTKTALQVAEAKGIITGTLLQNNISITEIHPNHVKIAITGNGSATKSDILWMLPKIIQIDPTGKLDDELDAIAIGIAYCAHYRFELLQK